MTPGRGGTPHVPPRPAPPMDQAGGMVPLRGDVAGAPGVALGPQRLLTVVPVQEPGAALPGHTAPCRP